MRIFKKLRRNGETEKQSVPAGKNMFRFMIWTILLVCFSNSVRVIMMKIRILENVEIRFHDIGHLLGSSCIEIWITESGITKKTVFSGDVGNTNQPIIKDPTPIYDTDDTDYLVIESTYGNRFHTEVPDYITLLAGNFREHLTGAEMLLYRHCCRQNARAFILYTSD